MAERRVWCQSEQAVVIGADLRALSRPESRERSTVDAAE
jgi:hypothetical protein